MFKTRKEVNAAWIIDHPKMDQIRGFFENKGKEVEVKEQEEVKLFPSKYLMRKVFFKVNKICGGVRACVSIYMG